MSEKIFVIPPHRTRYLSEIAENNRKYDETALSQVEVAQKLYGIFKTVESVNGNLPQLDKAGIVEDSLKINADNKDFVSLLTKEFDRVKMNLDPYNWEIILTWDEKVNKYKNPVYSFKVRDKEIKIATHTESLIAFANSKSSLTKIPSLGRYFKMEFTRKCSWRIPFCFRIVSI